MSSKNTIIKSLPTILTVAGILLVIGLALIVKGIFFKEQPQQRKVVQQITVISAPPPPPPPPPEKIQEPEPEEEVVKEEIDEPVPDEPAAEPAGEDLGVDAEGSAGGDGFGLVARKGGTGLLGTKASYGAYVKGELQKALMSDKELRRFEYRAVIKVWLAENGTVERTDVDAIEGQPQVAELLKAFLTKFPEKIKSKPLEDQENYYELKISSIY